MAYTPPTGSTVDFVASGGSYAAPAGNAVVFYSYVAASSLYANGWDSQSFGTPAAITRQFVTSYGSEYAQFGSALAYNFNQTIRVYPFVSQPPTPPSPTVRNLLQYVYANGLSFGAFGTQRVSNYYRSIYVSGASAGAFGTTKAMLGRRYVTSVGMPGTQTAFGTPTASHWVRAIYPTGYATGVAGTPSVADKAKRVRPVGLASSTQFGAATVRDRAQRFYPFGHSSAEFGWPFTYTKTRVLRPTGMAQWDRDKDRFGAYLSAYNRNRAVHTNGYTHTTFGTGGLVYNKATPLRPVGIAAPGVGHAQVTFRNRSVLVDAWTYEAAFGTSYLRNRNKVINLDGWGHHSLRAGIPRVWSNQQTVRPYSTTPMGAFGRPWASQGLRVVNAFGFDQSYVAWPRAGYRVQAISPGSISMSYVGTHALSIHVNKLAVWGYDSAAIGAPAVRNVTPEIHVLGAAPFSAGRPTVKLMRRYVMVTGFLSQSVGRPYVAYRTRTVRPPSLNVPAVGYPAVMFDQSQLAPPLQRLFPPSVQAGAGVIEYLPDEPHTGDALPMESPTLRRNAIYAPSIQSGATFGTPFTRSMVVFCNPGVADTKFGRAVLSGGTQKVKPWSIGELLQWGGPLVVGTQYVRHCYYRDGDSWAFYNHHADGYDVGPAFGAASVSTRHRRLLVNSGDPDNPAAFTALGTPRVTTNPQRIYPGGVLSYKRGTPSLLLAGDQPVVSIGSDMSAFGATEVILQDYGAKSVLVTGIQLGGFGAGAVQLKNRRVLAHPWDSLYVAPAKYVGPYLRVYPNGTDTSTFGAPFVAPRVRSLYQLDVTNDPPEWVGAKVKHEARGYFIEGTPSSVQFGVPDVAPRVKVVRPVGWQEFQTGFSYVPTHYPGLSKLKSQAFIASPHTNTLEFGNGAVSHA